MRRRAVALTCCPITISGNLNEENLEIELYGILLSLSMRTTTIAQFIISSISDIVSVDVRRITRYDAAGLEVFTENAKELSSPLTVDDTVYTNSNDSTFINIRELSTGNVFTVEYFISGLGNRASLTVRKW